MFLKNINSKNILLKYKAFIVNYKLINLPKETNNPIILKEKLYLFKILSQNFKKNITSIKSLILESKLNFGNQFLLLNKAIFYCEILGCKRIILKTQYFWYIKNKITSKNKILIKTENKTIFNNQGTIFDKTFFFFIILIILNLN